MATSEDPYFPSRSEHCPCNPFVFYDLKMFADLCSAKNLVKFSVGSVQTQIAQTFYETLSANILFSQLKYEIISGGWRT